MSPRTFSDYKATTDLLIEQFGKQRLVSDLRPDDFAALRKAMTTRKWGSHRLVKGIQYTRSAFKFAFESDLIPVPMRFGPSFKRPSKRTMRVERAKQGAKLFTREEIHQLLGAAGTSMRAMILLGLNCGYGNADCGTLPLAAVDLERGWIDYARPKTGIGRRCPLWPETVQALREVLAKRKEPEDEDDAGLFFITKYGDAWAKSTSDNPVTKEVRKLLNGLGLNGHRNFYCLRHTFRTIADEALDQPSCDHIMGHESPHRSTIYREKISDARLQAVVDHVRGWLFPPAPDQPTGKRAVEKEE